MRRSGGAVRRHGHGQWRGRAGPHSPGGQDRGGAPRKLHPIFLPRRRQAARGVFDGHLRARGQRHPRAAQDARPAGRIPDGDGQHARACHRLAQGVAGMRLHHQHRRAPQAGGLHHPALHLVVALSGQKSLGHPAHRRLGRQARGVHQGHHVADGVSPAGQRTGSARHRARGRRSRRCLRRRGQGRGRRLRHGRRAAVRPARRRRQAG